MRKIIFIFILTMGIFCGAIGCTSKDNLILEDEITNQEEQLAEEEHGIQFPYTIDDYKIEIESLSMATFPNPDAGGEKGEDIACLEIKNTTGQFILKANLVMTLEDGSSYEFQVFDLPDAETILAFEINNSGYDGKTACESIKVVEIEMAEEVESLKEIFSIEVNETEVTMTNISERDISEFTITCHCKFDESYFGGISYSYIVEGVSAAETLSVDALECYLGEAEVVRLRMDGIDYI